MKIILFFCLSCIITVHIAHEFILDSIQTTGNLETARASALPIHVVSVLHMPAHRAFNLGFVLEHIGFATLVVLSIRDIMRYQITAVFTYPTVDVGGSRTNPHVHFEGHITRFVFSAVSAFVTAPFG